MPQRIHIQIHKSKQQSNIEVSKASTTPPTILHHNLGLKNYELSNHLGNVYNKFASFEKSCLLIVMPTNQKDVYFQNTSCVGITTVISDRKIPRGVLGTNIDFYMPDIVSATDYYPFGMTMQERTFSAGGEAYRFGFNGKENDAESNTQDYGMRIYDGRLGRFLSVDPLTSKFAMLTPFQFASNTPIMAIDLDGKEALIIINTVHEGYTQTLTIYNDEESFVQTRIDLAKEMNVPLQELPPNGTLVFTRDHTNNTKALQYNSTHPTVILDTRSNLEKLQDFGKKMDQRYQDDEGFINLCDDISPVLDVAGNGARIIGYGAMCFGQFEIGVPLVEIGNAIDKFSDGIEVANAFAKGGTVDGIKIAGKKAIFEVVSGGLEKQVGKFGLDENSKKLLDARIELQSEGVEKSYDKLNEDDGQ